MKRSKETRWRRWKLAGSVARENFYAGLLCFYFLCSFLRFSSSYLFVHSCLFYFNNEYFVREGRGKIFSWVEFIITEMDGIKMITRASVCHWNVDCTDTCVRASMKMHACVSVCVSVPLSYCIHESAGIWGVYISQHGVQIENSALQTLFVCASAMIWCPIVVAIEGKENKVPYNMPIWICINVCLHMPMCTWVCKLNIKLEYRFLHINNITIILYSTASSFICIQNVE